MGDVNWHSLTITEVREQHKVDTLQGLSEQEASIRLSANGRNALPPPPKKSKLSILVNQFNDMLIYILIFAAMATLALSLVKADGIYSIEYFFDTIVIVAVLVINAAIGFYQEWKAEIAVNSLQTMISDKTVVIRDGHPQLVDSEELVVGDIVELRTGEKISADIRVIEVENLKVNKSALTGESEPVTVSTAPLPISTPLADRSNMVYMGTFVEMGRGKGIVVATADETEVGKIYEMVSSIASFKTPLQRKLEEFSSSLAKVILGLAIFLVAFGLAIEFGLNSGQVDPLEAVLDLVIIGVSLAVAAIPEGLPIILTFTLAISVQKLAERNSIIRNLQAVETLGGTTTIATDKTGTLTLNQLKLVGIHTLDQTLKPEEGVLEFPDILEVLQNVTLPIVDSDPAILDPLDRALLQEFEERFDRVEYSHHFSFDSERKMMSVIVNEYLFAKGAPDVLIERSTGYRGDTLTDSIRKSLHLRLEELASQGFRVIGIAKRRVASSELSEGFEVAELEQQLNFLGFLAFIDPPRPEVFHALDQCRTAGINVVMITGDHPSTAYTIARQLEIVGDQPKDQVTLTGTDIDNMDDEKLKEVISRVKVYARVTPAHKLRLVTLLKDRGEIVAMTGDGVNDSPALVMADIGVSMGIAGTDAAKESSDMILLDDNFATLVDAVEEGRRVNVNIRKFTNYLLASNISEVLIILFGFAALAIINPSLLRELIPLSETQILYLNLVTDSFLALALGLEVRERSIMQEPPRNPDSPIVGRTDLIRIVLIGAGIALLNVIVFLVMLGPVASWSSLGHSDVAFVQSYTLTLLVISEVFIAVSYRSSKRVWNIDLFDNPLFIISLVLVLLGQLAILYIPVLNLLFDTRPLGLIHWVQIIAISLFVFFGLELSKRAPESVPPTSK